MKKLLLIGLLILSQSIFITVNGQDSPKEKGLAVLTNSSMKAQLRFLSSDLMEGRHSFDRGGRVASEYITSLFEMAGLEPAGDLLPDGTRSFYQKIPMLVVDKYDESYMKITTKTGSTTTSNRYNYNTEVFSKRHTGNNVVGELVFAGYGLVDEKIGYNDLKDALHLEGKIIVVLDGFPQHQAKHFAKKYNVRNAKNAGLKRMAEHGAIAVVRLTSMKQYNDLAEGKSYNKSHYGSETPAYPRPILASPLQNPETITDVLVSPRAASDILADSDIVESYINAKSNEYTPLSIGDKTIELNSIITTRLGVIYNVLALLKGEDSSKSFVVGAHYDHFGMEGNFIWNGADDNASGVVAVTSSAQAFAASGITPKYDIIFAAWSGEELGLVGSTYFVANFGETHSYSQLIGNMNYDMLSRSYDEDKEQVEFDYEYSALYPEYKTYGADNIKKYKLNLKPRYWSMKVGDYSGSTDYVPFFRSDISIIAFYAGHHSDYHKPTDEFEVLHFPKFYNLVKLGFLNTYDIVENFELK